MPKHSMNEQQRAVFQGIVYYYRDNRVICRHTITLHDPIDPVCLQAALDAVRPLAPYFFQKVVWDRREAHLEENHAPFPIQESTVQPWIPEQTNGYLFSLRYAGRRLFFDWFHFIADGRGCSPFLTRLLMAYCNRRYGTDFVCSPLVSDPPYDIEALLERYPESQVKSNMKRDALEICEGQPALARLRLDKQSLVALAVRNQVRPVSALLALLIETMRHYLGRNSVSYGFPSDTRDALGLPNALYNCVASFERSITIDPTAPFSALVAQVDADLCSDLTDENRLLRMAEQMGWVYQVSQQKASLSIKKRIFQMGEYLSGFPSDFWLSYLGAPFSPADPELAAFVESFETWVLPDGASLGLEVTSLHGVITLCIENKVPRPNLLGTLRTVLEREGIRVLDADELPPLEVQAHE